MQPHSTPPALNQTESADLDPAGEYLKRKQTALWYSVSLLALSVVILTVGLVTSTRTDNVPVTGFYPGIILIAAIIFISLGIKACFFCAIIDGVIAAEFLFTCRHHDGCDLRVKANSCFCCDLFSCKGPEYYYEFTGVKSCWDVVHLHRLMWACVTLNVIAIFLGIVTAAVLGAFRHLSPEPLVVSSGPAMIPMPPSPVPPPHMLYNPTPVQHLMHYPGFCPSGQALPVYPSYPMPMQHHPGLPPPMPNMPQPNSEASLAPLEETQPPSQTPNSPSNTPTSQDDSSHSAPTPNAPTFYTQEFSVFEKPPPYAT
ncbi:hypothetical protein ACEWY4_016242 [Coilia grayii]|uniref:Uncharacterized protein n=1 Tax=Coilia grayii TaxID=363190 RepID=A0ABD1JKU2_9TELE